MNENVILFDGYCRLCNRFVDFILKQDTKRKIKFASLQSSFGQSVLKEHFSSLRKFPDSVVLLTGEKVYTHSTAALHVFRILGMPWKVLYVFIIVPAFIRNGIYNFIAANRNKWFGKRNECRIPTKAEEERFITD
ncbi:MAG: DUF393 domain-containing protein [Bacteroidetes bacterium]|nr:DUF393 domain-containing protein [Bacteroidota bacterium]